jgi:hypothetical protein
MTASASNQAAPDPASAIARRTRFLIRTQLVLIPAAVLSVLYLGFQTGPLLKQLEALRSQIAADSARADSLGALSLQLQASLASHSLRLRSLTAQNDSLDRVRTRLESDVQALVSWKDTLLKRVAGSAPVGEQPRAENARYAIGLYALGVTDEQLGEVTKLLEDKGYVLTTATRMSERQSWLSRKATVLYYSDSSAVKARKLAATLTQATGTPFGTAKGQGLGVIQGQERWTFYVHYVTGRGGG